MRSRWKLPYRAGGCSLSIHKVIRPFVGRVSGYVSANAYIVCSVPLPSKSRAGLLMKAAWKTVLGLFYTKCGCLSD